MLEDPSADLSDEDLLAFVSDIRSTTHTVGESLVTGSLRSRGYRVSRERVYVRLFVPLIHLAVH